MSKTKVTDALNYYHQNQSEFLSELFDFLRIPSISTSEINQGDVQKAAVFLKNKLTELGFEKVKVCSTPMHPIIYAEKIVDPQKPTILVYGHYDVQPPDPLSEWNTPPFEPKIESEYLLARGASDMKGQIWAAISALQSILQTGELTANIKFLIEGEEEIGSPSLDPFLMENKALLTCDMILNPDGSMLAPDKPTIIYALRGMAYFELRVYGPSADLHSGTFGGVVDNPANVLCRLIGGMHDEFGRVTLPGFYNGVRSISPQESAELSKIGMEADVYKALTGVPALGGEAGFQPIERIGARPTLDVNGFYAGYIEEGAKTIIPAYAMAKISSRLVPDQDPENIEESLKQYLKENAPDTVRWELEMLSGATAYIAEAEAPGVSSFIDALEQTWRKPPIRKREGGSIPVATSMKNILGVDSIITGFGLPDDQIHSPNERMHLPTHYKGVEALIRFFCGF